MKKHYLIYGGIGVALLVALYFATKSESQTTTEEQPTDNGGDVQQGSDKTKEQINLDPTLAQILSQSNWSSQMFNKNIYTKIADAKLRDNELVNDGIISNLYGTIPNAGTLVGSVVGGYLDTGGGINPITKTRYKWFKVKITDSVYKDIQKQKSFLTRDLFKPTNVYKFIREDVIKL